MKRSQLLTLGFGLLAMVQSCRNAEVAPEATLEQPSVRAASTEATAVVSSFDGVNWADGRDNFVDGWIIPSGIDHNQSATQIASTADVILGQFQTKLSANTVRLGINYPSVNDATYWPKYKAIIDKASSKGMKVILGYWEGASSKDGLVDNQTQFDAMWDKVVNDYKANPNVFFEIFNEPHGYSATDWKNFAANWITRQLPKFNERSRILVGGTGYSENVAAVGSDSRFNGCLFSQHIYPWWGNYTTEAAWKQNLSSRVGAYASRTIVTEFGAAMKTRASNYFSTFPRDGEVDRAFMTGVPNQIRETNMGSVYWPGLRDGDDFSLTNRSGSGTNTILTITNSSGKDQVWWSFNK